MRLFATIESWRQLVDPFVVASGHLTGVQTICCLLPSEGRSFSFDREGPRPFELGGPVVLLEGPVTLNMIVVISFSSLH